MIKRWHRESAGVIVSIRGNQVAGVRVNAKEVSGAADAMNLLRGKFRQPGSRAKALLLAQVPDALDHHLGVVAVLREDWMAEPAHIELHGTLGGLAILRRVRVPRLRPRRVQGDANATSLSLLEEIPVHVHHLSVGLEQIVAAQIGGNAREVVRGRHVVHSIAMLAHMPRLIDGRPDLHPIAVHLKDQAGKVLEQRYDLRIGPAAQLLQLLRQLPMIDRHHGRDVVTQEFIDQVGVVLDAGSAHVVHVATGHDTGPGQGETIGSSMQFLYHLDIATPLKKIKNYFKVFNKFCWCFREISKEK